MRLLPSTTVHTFIYMLYFSYSLYFIRKNRGYLDDNLIKIKIIKKKLDKETVVREVSEDIEHIYMHWEFT